jgi:mono/diheme cytochrome c family protein
VRLYAALLVIAGMTSSVAADETTPAPAATSPAPAEAADGALYTVEDGNKVDTNTLNGWKTWRALACERCHGAEQEGMVGPSLIESLKTLPKEQFHTVMMTGRIEKGMPPFDTSEMVNKNWEGLYAYLKGRSDGRIQPGKLYPIETQ